MSEKNRSKYPFHTLGRKLKNLREKLKESLVEVSGAVEIDTEVLSRYEQGSERPSEDILGLLINHFEIKDEEASKLWELAGYTRPDATDGLGYEDDVSGQKPIMMVMPMDARIVYSDMAQIAANNFGVVMNFMQTAGPNGQPLAIARIGMSMEHAKSILGLLEQTIDQAQKQESTPKALPAPKSKRNKSKTDKN